EQNGAPSGINQAGGAARQREDEEQDETEIGGHGATDVAGHGGAQNADCQRKKEGVHQYQNDPPEFPVCDAAEQEWDCQDRQDGQHSVKCPERTGRQLAQDDVVAFQVREKKEAECAFTFFLAQAIGGGKPACNQAINEAEDRQTDEDVTSQI